MSVCVASLQVSGACLHVRSPTDSLLRRVRSLSPSRAAVVRTGAAFVVIAAFSGPVYAQTSAPTVKAPGAGALERAKAAWDAGDFDLVAGLYGDALNSGGLTRTEVVRAYARMGAALAVTGNARKALAALRTAAVLDPEFTLPVEAGKRAMGLAERARREQARAAPLALAADAPQRVDPGSPFAVQVDLTSPGPPLVAVDAVTLDAREPLTGRSFQQRSAPEPQHRFEIPARMALPDASLLLVVRALDAHGNELALAERRVHVGPARKGAGESLAARPAGGGDHASHPSGGFWKSPWPYVVGGVTLAAGGAALYFATRSTADVNVGPARVELVP
jgi:hypothetical protein